MPRMLNKLFPLLLSLLWMLALVMPVWAAEIDDAKRAYGAGEFENAAGLLRPLARDGSAQAQYLLGRMYEQGDGVARDEAEAKKLFKLAADQGHDNAGQRLALYENADSGEESVVLEWYLPAAEEGDMEAQYNLGFMYETGWGVGIDEKMAANWYKEASDLQHDMAQLRLGMMYVVGSGVAKDVDQGVELLRLAAENGNRVAEVLVQEVFDNDDARELDVDRIIRGLRRSVDDGEQQALNTLNTSLDRARRRIKRERREVATESVVRQTAKTTKKEKPSTLASEKVSSAQFNIARAMDKGLGIPQNEPEMVKWYITAARQGNADAQFNLGILYVQGRGVSKDIQEGMRWFNAAASQGHELSKDYLQLWNDELDNATLGGSIAITWLKENARNWDLDSLYMMGQMFETGRGVNRNLNEARIWYRLAAEGGHKNARRQFDMVGRGNITTNTGSGSTISTSSKALPTNQDTRTTGKAVATQFDWFWMILGFVGVAGLGFVIFILFRRSGGKMPTYAASKSGTGKESLFGVPDAAHNVSMDDADFLKGLWSDAPASSTAATNTPDPVPAEQKPVSETSPEEAGATEVFKAVTWGRDSGKPPIISEDDIQLPDIKAVMTNETVRDEVADTEKPHKTGAVRHIEMPKNGVPKLADGETKKVLPATASKRKERNSVVDAPVSDTSPSDTSPSDNASEKLSAKLPTKKVIEERSVWTRSDSQLVSAEDIAGSGISRDDLASGRISADNLFGEGFAIDKDGTAAPKKTVQPKPASASVHDDEKEQTPVHSGPIDFADLDLQSIRKGGKKDIKAELNIKSEGPVSAFQSADEPPNAVPDSQSVSASQFEVVPASASTTSPEALAREPSASAPAIRAQTPAQKTEAEDLSETRSLAEVHFNIGLMFAKGDGAPRNDVMAAKWFLKAAEEGLAEAQFHVGEMYLSGSGIEKDPTLGMEWIRKAADSGDAGAQAFLNKRRASF